MALTDTPEDGAPVQIGLSVDETSPTAAAEGDVRRARGSAEGDAMMQPAFEGADIATVNGMFVQGPAASDAPELGNPVQLGGSVDNTAPASAAEGDVRRVRSSPQGKLLSGIGGATLQDGTVAPTGVVQQDDTTRPLLVIAAGVAPDGSNDRLRTLGDVAVDGLGQLCTTPAVPGASVVTNIFFAYGVDAQRKTIATPSAGTRIRIISMSILNSNVTGTSVEIYFGTGSSIGINPSKAAIDVRLEADIHPTETMVFPDGAGPVGAVDDVLSLRSQTILGANNGQVVIQYREE